ncbi:MAG TPA: hypothetical protein ENN64_01055 [bacterium]|nr:hypothetical protein [bacterium]
MIEYVKEKIKDLFPENYALPEGVLRHGDDVEELSGSEYLDESNEFDKLFSLLREEKKRGSYTIAIISKDKNDADRLFKKISKFEDKLNSAIYNYNSDNFVEGVIFLDPVNAKGLEFDTVIITDFSQEKYLNNFADAKSFYVAATRALHRLYIIKN